MTTALVTGANRGIGRAIADGLEARGITVFRTMRQPSDPFPDAVALELGDAASIAAAAAHLAERIDHLDLLINNAATHLAEGQPLEEQSGEDLSRTLAVNCVGVHLLTRALLPLLEAASAGARVINVSSGAGQLSSMETFSPAYSISKTALNALTRQQAGHYKARQITVNCLCPGWCRTDMGGPNATRSPEEGADTAIWLALDAPAALTGKFFRDREEIPW